MTELKNCPFCGGDKARTIHIRDGRKVACICGACGKPEFHGPLDKPDAETRAIAAWNQRAPVDGLETIVHSSMSKDFERRYALDEGLVERVFAEDVIAQSYRLGITNRYESPGQWMLRVRKAAMIEALQSKRAAVDREAIARAVAGAEYGDGHDRPFEPFLAHADAIMQLLTASAAYHAGRLVGIEESAKVADEQAKHAERLAKEDMTDARVTVMMASERIAAAIRELGDG